MTNEPETFEQMSASDDVRLAERRCFIKGDNIYLNVVPETCTGGLYEIELERLDSEAKLLGWLLHLFEKNWTTTLQLHQFVCLVCEHHDLALDRDA